MRRRWKIKNCHQIVYLSTNPGIRVLKMTIDCIVLSTHIEINFSIFCYLSNVIVSIPSNTICIYWWEINNNKNVPTLLRLYKRTHHRLQYQAHLIRKICDIFNQSVFQIHSLQINTQTPSHTKIYCTNVCKEWHRRWVLVVYTYILYKFHFIKDNIRKSNKSFNNNKNNK